jgi:hypothetical protein
MVVFAGVMLMLEGSFEVMQGFVAFLRDDYYRVSASGLLVPVNYTAWGWAHLIVGIASVGAGIGVLAGQTWARVVGIVIAVLGVLANMAFLSAYPIWSTIVIVIDVLAIYALAAHGREVRY